MRTSNLLVEGLGKNVNSERVIGDLSPKGDLGKDLVGEGARHDP